MAPLPRIAVDAMGGDGGPAVTVPAAVALAEHAEITLVGDAGTLRRALTKAGATTCITVHPAAEVLSAADSLADALRRKPDSSMRQALLRHSLGAADAVVSAGDTAALMGLSRSILSMVPGIERPAICKQMRGVGGPFWMLDLGANLDCTPAQLQQFAHMGSLLARHVGGISAPRVAVLNIGTEAGKGPELLQETAKLLEADSRLRYAGFIEGNALFSGVADVVVADGFAGNVALKAIEGAARMAGHLLQDWLGGLSPLEHAGIALSRSKFEGLRHQLNPQSYNGACFVGLAGVVIKSHGSADVSGFRSAIEEAVAEVKGSIPGHIAAEVG